MTFAPAPQGRVVIREIDRGSLNIGMMDVKNKMATSPQKVHFVKEST
jgi:hypothetical protein